MTIDEKCREMWDSVEDLMWGMASYSPLHSTTLNEHLTTFHPLSQGVIQIMTTFSIHMEMTSTRRRATPLSPSVSHVLQF